MISFTLPIAFSVISTMLSINSWICREVPGPIITTGPHHSNLQSLGWCNVGFGRGKNDPEQRWGRNRNPGTDRAAQANFRQTAPEIHGSLVSPRRGIVQSVSAETRQGQYASIAVYGNTHRRTFDPGVR